ncbi:MAG: CHASE3 domain-containing protein, partial [Pedobacter sp.]|nr:CHASE3 domain-containing protein [Pedobacter sp.]
MQKTLKNNLRIGLGLSLIILFISSLASYMSIQNLIKSSGMVSHSNLVMSNLDGIISTLKDAETGQRGYLLTGEDLFLQPYAGAKDEAIRLLNNVEQETKDNPVQQSSVKKLRTIIQDRLSVLDRTIQIKKAGGSVSVGDLLTGKEYMDNARTVIKTMQTDENNLLISRTSDQNKLAGYTPMLIILAAAFAILITIFFYRRVSSDFNTRVVLQQELQDKNDEIDHRIQVIQGIASQISSGDYKVRLDQDAKDGLGSLAGSLNAMAESLQYSFSLLEDKEWLQSGIARLNDKMVGDKSVSTLTNDILENIIEHTGAQVAAFYLLEEDRLLHITGSYALIDEQRKEMLKAGEGLAGQALKSEKMILLNDIPEGELTISYAVGNTRPRNIVAVPVIRDRMVVGVMEFGSLNIFTPLQLEFFTSISGNIGIAVQSAQNRKRLQDFLEETQAQAEELQAQHSELEGLNAELEAQTQKIQTSEEEL